MQVRLRAGALLVDGKAALEAVETHLRSDRMRLARGEQPRLLAGCLALTGLLLFALLPFALGWAGLALACAAGALLARASRSNASV